VAVSAKEIENDNVRPVFLNLEVNKMREKSKHERRMIHGEQCTKQIKKQTGNNSSNSASAYYLN